MSIAQYVPICFSLFFFLFLIQATNLPVKWRFFDGAEFTVLAWDEGAILDDHLWQVNCVVNYKAL